MPTLFSNHPLVLATAYSELKRQAAEQSTLLVGTPGSVSIREVGGRPYLYRQFYDALGKKQSQYLGPVGETDAEARSQLVRQAIEQTNALLTQARLLARQGYVRTPSAAAAVITAVARRGLFRSGGVLVGSHAYGALLNELGVRAAAFHTLDVDLARAARIEADATFAAMLSESFVPLSPIPSLDRKSPSTSFSAPGREGLRVDLLMPTSGTDVVVRAVPELSAHAAAMPHLGALVEAPISAIVLGHEGVVPVRVPRPERLAWHKVLVSQLRGGSSDKRSKDLHQAAVLLAALAERDPASIEEAFASSRAKKKVREGAVHVLELLARGGHDRAAEIVRMTIE